MTQTTQVHLNLSPDIRFKVRPLQQHPDIHLLAVDGTGSFIIFATRVQLAAIATAITSYLDSASAPPVDLNQPRHVFEVAEGNSYCGSCGGGRCHPVHEAELPEDRQP